MLCNDIKKGAFKMKGIRFFAALYAAKLASLALSVMHRNGTHMPGVLAMKICPDFLGRMDKPKTIIGITGTNGKTTTANMINDILADNGYSPVNNRAGSNILGGVATTLISAVNLRGKTVKDLAVLELERLDGVAGGLADHVQLPLQRVGGHDVAAAPDEDLADHRLGLLHRGRHRHGLVDRHIAPAQHDLAFQAHGALQLLFASEARSVFLWQEDHTDAVFAGRRQVDALLGHLFAEELIGNLQQDARAVAHQRVSADGAPVVEVVQDTQALLDDLVALLALDVSDEADAASVVFIGRVVQTLGRRLGRERMLFHGDLPMLWVQRAEESTPWPSHGCRA